MKTADSTPPHVRGSSWPSAVASILFSLATYHFFSLYSFVHWRVLSSHYAELGPELRPQLFSVLHRLESYRLLGFCAVIFLVLAFRGTPRWPAYVALPFALLALLSVLSIQ